MAWFLFHGNHEFSALSGDLGRVVPFDITGRPVMQVHGFPIWIVPGVECPAVVVEFITEDDCILAAIRADPIVCIGWGRIINQLWEIGELGDLTSTIGGVEATLVRRVPPDGIDNRVCAEQGQESAAQHKESENVCPTSSGEQSDCAI